jgi:phospholipase D1/2
MHLIDPALPHETDRLIAVVAAGRRRTIYRYIRIMAAAVIVLGTLALVWWLTPLREWINIHRAVAAMNALGDSPLAPLAMLAAFLIGGLVMIPVNILIAVTVLVFGPLLGAAYALLGAELSAALLYEIGRHFPAGDLRRRLERATQRLRGRLHKHGLLAVAVVRVVPVAPYSVVNLAAGAMRIPRAQYLAGTALGMLPGIVFNAVFIDRVVEAMERPNPWSYALLIGAGALIVALIVLIRRRVARAHA